MGCWGKTTGEGKRRRGKTPGPGGLLAVGLGVGLTVRRFILISAKNPITRHLSNFLRKIWGFVAASAGEPGVKLPKFNNFALPACEFSVSHQVLKLIVLTGGPTYPKTVDPFRIEN